MTKKLYILSIFIVFGLTLYGSPAPVSAQTTLTSTDRAALIEQLLAQIQFLQDQIMQLSAETESYTAQTTSDDFEIIETFFFGTDFEAIYEVDDRLQLIRHDQETSVRITDLRLWDLFLDTVGRNQAKEYIDEFRVFDKTTSSVGGFVELHRSTDAPDYWILGVNEDDFNPRSESSRRSYQVLFIHEFAHLLVEDQTAIMSDFEDEFWSRNDYRHSRSIEDLSGQTLEDALEDYYDDNEDRFVSDYATFNPDEDFAETFTYFVVNDKPNSRDTWSDKVDFMYDYDLLEDIRFEIRDNIDL